MIHSKWSINVSYFHYNHSRFFIIQPLLTSPVFFIFLIASFSVFQLCWTSFSCSNISFASRPFLCSFLLDSLLSHVPTFFILLASYIIFSGKSWFGTIALCVPLTPFNFPYRGFYLTALKLTAYLFSFKLPEIRNQFTLSIVTSAVPNSAWLIEWATAPLSVFWSPAQQTPGDSPDGMQRWGGLWALSQYGGISH